MKKYSIYIYELIKPFFFVYREYVLIFPDYNKCCMVYDMMKILIPIHTVGFLLGMIMTSFGEISTNIVIKYISLYLYQYLLGNILINLITGILFIYTQRIHSYMKS